MMALCKASNRFPKVPGYRAANVVCEKPSGHPGSHEAVKGGTAYCWSCKHEERCCPEHEVHVTPHRGCILR